MAARKKAKLKRDLNLFQTTVFGLGNILGAGIYALIGVVAAKAGIYTPIAFLVALVLAAFTALCYMEFSSRYPLASGEAIYIFESFKNKIFAVVVGLMIAFAGLVSSATMMRSFVAYLNSLYGDLKFAELIISPEFLIVLAVLILASLAIWGITESTWVAIVITSIETFGLLMIVWVAKSNFLKLPEMLPSMFPSVQEAFNIELWQGILLGAFIAFYAFIGFEDMVTIAEEVKNPRINMPLAILFALIAATIIYLTISVIAVLSLDPLALAQSKAPMALIYETSTGLKPVIITFISMFAVTNGALMQIIKASRMIYGMSEQKWLPKVFTQIHPKTQTPVLATVLVTVTILVLALVFDLEFLAASTSMLVLLVFGLVNFGLFRLKLSMSKYECGKKANQKLLINLPKLIPFLGFMSCFALIFVKLMS